MKAADINVQMFDMVGKLLKSDRHKNMSEGKHVLSLDAGGLATGVYTVKLKVEGTELTKRIVIH